MDKRVILAVAGAGKTYYICHAINPKKRNLILAYTHENVNNIRKELISADGGIPELTTVMTFDAFVFRCLICPYEPSIGENFGIKSFVGKGVSMIDPPSQMIKVDGKYIPNTNYVTKDKKEHYLTENNQYYCSRISELILYIGKGKNTLITRAAKRLNLFFDQVLIDEFQDFREYNYELIVKLARELNNVILVGDYYQHSVSGENTYGKPFKKGKKIVTYLNFVEELKKHRFDVDDKTLKQSRRCSSSICSFVREKLGIHIESAGINEGKVIWVDRKDLDRILNDSSIVKLVNKEADKYSFYALNWSYSKGDTVDAACVILTDKFEKMEYDNFSALNIPDITKNKLYVALTRSKGDLFLVKSSVFKKRKQAYRK